MPNTLYILTGPTASGKTHAALDWAEVNHAEIVSCDAVQVYCGMNIGTAKATAEEQARIPHHCMDLVSVNECFDIKQYMEAAREAVESIIKRKRKVLVVGGSGFYLKSFLAPVADDVVIPPAIAEEISRLYQEAGLTGLTETLTACNPDGLGGLDLQNPRRLTRALERCLATGMTYLELKQDFESLPDPYPDFKKRVVIIERDPESLKARVMERTKAMIQAGFVEEVKGLLASGLDQNPSASAAIGYAQTIDWLKRDGPIAELEKNINQATTRLLRKQRTWFRHQIPQDVIVHSLL